MPNTGLICSQCDDVADVVTPLNGGTLSAKTTTGEMVVALHTRCEGAWAEKNNCERFVSLRKMHRRYASHSAPGSATVARAFPLVS
jgi:hypothetical protein